MPIPPQVEKAHRGLTKTIDKTIERTKGKLSAKDIKILELAFKGVQMMAKLKGANINDLKWGSYAPATAKKLQAIGIPVKAKTSSKPKAVQGVAARASAKKKASSTTSSSTTSSSPKAPSTTSSSTASKVPNGGIHFRSVVDFPKTMSGLQRASMDILKGGYLQLTGKVSRHQKKDSLIKAIGR